MTWIASRYTLQTHAVEALAPYEHAFTHFDLTLHPLTVRVVASRVDDADQYVWYDTRRPPRIGLAKPAVELIRLLSDEAVASA